jgi:hypothetical protein
MFASGRIAKISCEQLKNENRYEGKEQLASASIPYSLLLLLV